MKRLQGVGFALLFGLTVAACGGGSSGPAGSCNVTGTGAMECVDFNSGYNSSQAQQACTQSGGTYSSSACTSAMRVGRCTLSQGQFSQTANFYPPTTAADAMTACQAQGGTFAAN